MVCWLLRATVSTSFFIFTVLLSFWLLQLHVSNHCPANKMGELHCSLSMDVNAFILSIQHC